MLASNDVPLAIPEDLQPLPVSLAAFGLHSYLTRLTFRSSPLSATCRELATTLGISQQAIPGYRSDLKRTGMVQMDNRQAESTPGIITVDGRRAE